MDLEELRLSQKSQSRNSNTAWYNLYEASKTNNKQISEKEIRFVIIRGRVCRIMEVDKGGQKTQISSFKNVKYWGGQVQDNDYS